MHYITIIRRVKPMNQKPDLRTEVPESPIKTKSFFDSIRYAFKGVG